MMKHSPKVKRASSVTDLTSACRGQRNSKIYNIFHQTVKTFFFVLLIPLLTVLGSVTISPQTIGTVLFFFFSFFLEVSYSQLNDALYLPCKRILRRNTSLNT